MHSKILHIHCPDLQLGEYLSSIYKMMPVIELIGLENLLEICAYFKIYLPWSKVIRHTILVVIEVAHPGV